MFPENTQPDENKDRTTVFLSTRIYPGDGAPFSGHVKVSGTKIVDAGPGRPKEVTDSPGQDEAGNIVDLGDNIVIPGLIDLHIHGSYGFDVASQDPEAISAMARYLAGTGTTAFLPTLGAMPVDLTCEIVERVSRLVGKNRHTGAEILGLHLEGPFLNPLKKGAMREEYLLEPSVGLMSRWFELSKGSLNHVAIAPELPGAQEVISFLAGRKVAVAAGHTMATYEQALDSISWGVTVANHTYNAMREFRHRDPGILGAVFTDNRIWAELLCDGIHVHPAAVLTVLAAKGLDKAYLVSDALTPAGLPPGQYSSLGHGIMVDEDGKAYLDNGTLAGSTATLLDCLKNVVCWTQRPLEDVLPLAALNPAKVAGVANRKGSLASGKDADFVVLDSEYNVILTVVNGECREPNT
ncbi:MAG: N-acetylglucosamine-6-phosphate deacetylase [Bacillota bacterium]